MMTNAEELFEHHFGGPASYEARSPGRVNLIGEHLDYNGLPVLPMALQRGVSIVLRPRDDGIVSLQNASPEFEPFEFEIAPGLPPEAQGHWGNYAKAPANQLARRFAIWRGFDGLVLSDLPVASGLSSSTALVNAMGLALARVNEVPVDPIPFAQLMADAERFTGTMGGSMDHAVSMAARAGSAARVTFDPLRVRHLRVPEDWCFVVANSGVRAEKSGQVQTVYNLRRSECEQALEQLGHAVVGRGMEDDVPKDYSTLLRALTSVGPLEFAAETLSGNLLKRFRHVATEAQRVKEACDHLVGADLQGFGMLMDASHGSLRTDFHVSSGELDELTAIAREGGAAGARLTGAGLGGCIVALTDRGTVGDVLDTLTSDYYESRGLMDHVTDHLFVAAPSDGSSFRSL
jgi:galactokinase